LELVARGLAGEALGNPAKCSERRSAELRTPVQCAARAAFTQGGDEKVLDPVLGTGLLAEDDLDAVRTRVEERLDIPAVCDVAVRSSVALGNIVAGLEDLAVHQDVDGGVAAPWAVG